MKKNIIFLLVIVFLSVSFLPVISKDTTASEHVNPASVILPYKDITYRINIISKMRRQASGLSESEKSVVKKYVYGAVRGEDTYLLINCYLRNNLQDYIPKKEITKPLKCRLEYYAHTLSDVISKTKLPKNIILYQSISEKDVKFIFKEKNISEVFNNISNESLEKVRKSLIGTKYAEKGFMLTSYDKRTLKNTKYMLQISAPKNLQAILIEDLNKNSQKQVLINKNTKWEITDIMTETDKNSKNKFYVFKIKIVL